MDGYRVFSVDHERFPDLKKLTADLDASDIKTVVILDPGIKKDSDYDIYRAGLENHLYVKNSNGTPVYGLYGQVGRHIQILPIQTPGNGGVLYIPGLSISVWRVIGMI